MSSRVLSTALLLLASLPCYAGPKPCDLPNRPQVDCEVPAHPALVGEIIIIGNTATPNDLILSRLPFVSGQMLDYPALQLAEQNLARLELFQNDPEGTGIRPTVTVLDPDGPAPVKHILVEVQEKCGAVQPAAVREEVSSTELAQSCPYRPTQAVGCASACVEPHGVCGGPQAGCSETCDNDKPACSCEKDCSCCGCKKVQDDEDIESVVNCNCGEGCKCCGCKKTIAQKDCQSGGCCAHAKNCCSGSLVGCFLLEQCCPVLRGCGMCPIVQIQVRRAMQPCMKKIFAACRQVFQETANDCNDSCADCNDCCADQAGAVKKSKCGACRQAVRVEIRVCPWNGVAGKHQATSFVWKKGQRYEQLSVLPQEEPAKQAAVNCPYLHQAPVKTAKQAKRSGLVVTPLDNLVKLEKAQRLMGIADAFYDVGQYEQAVKRYKKVMELAPGSQWDVKAQDSIIMAQAMKGIDEWYARFGQEVLDAHLEEMKKSATEEAEPIQVRPLPCEPNVEDQALQEFKDKFCALLDQAKCAADAGDLEIAKRLALEASQLPRPEVVGLLNAAQECVAAGCCEEAWDKVNHVLMLDPNCLAAQELQRQLIDIAAKQCDQCPFSSGCEQEESPCGDGAAASCPGIGFRHELPGVDPSIVSVMERVLIDCARPDRYDYEGDCEEQTLEIDDEACDLELLEDVELVHPIDPLSLQRLLHQIDDAVRDCVGVDGKSWPSKHAQIDISVRFGRVQCQMIMDQNGASQITVAIRPLKVQDLRDWQEAHNEAMRKWIEEMSGCGPRHDDDGEESEEPLYQLETDLDPDW